MTKPLQFRGYIGGLDVLRGIAVISVVIFHAFAGTAYDTMHGHVALWFTRLTLLGKNGVPLFFVLSGFLITGILTDSAEKPHYYKNFFIRRALRILPAYLLLLIVLKSTHIISWRFVLAAVLYIANMARLVGAHTNEYGVLWSLAVEEQFYLLWPYCVRHLSRHALLRICLLGVVLLPLLRVAMLAAGLSTYVTLPANADYLFFGAGVALCARIGLLTAANIRPLYRALGAAALLGLVPYTFLDLTAIHGFFYRALWEALGRMEPIVACLSGLLYAVAHNTGAPLRSHTARVFAFFGYISYGLYLVHLFVFGMYDRWARGTVLEQATTHFSLLVLRFAICAFIAVAISWLSRRFFEDPFLHLKGRLTPDMTKRAAQALDQTPV